MDAIKRLFDNDRFAKHAGIELIEFSPGRAQASMHITDKHLNGIGLVQGGAIFTLADFAFAVAVNSRGNIAVAVTTTITFLKAATEGTLIATAEEISLSNRLGTYRVTVTNENEETIAVFQGTAYRKAKKIEE